HWQTPGFRTQLFARLGLSSGQVRRMRSEGTRHTWCTQTESLQTNAPAATLGATSLESAAYAMAPAPPCLQPFRKTCNEISSRPRTCSSLPRRLEGNLNVSLHGNSSAAFRQALSFCFMAGDSVPSTWATVSAYTVTSIRQDTTESR